MARQDTSKINEALSVLNEAARDKKEELQELLSGKYDDLKAVVSDVESEISNSAGRAAQRLEELKTSASERVMETVQRVDRKAHEKPWKTFGWIVAGSFVIGFLLGRRD